MKPLRFEELERKVSILKKRCPWVATLLLHCLKTRNPQALEAMKSVLSRLRPSAI
ncbi:MAG: hypothetical protein V2A66_03325 [Pseudomonadota bacterium]